MENRFNLETMSSISQPPVPLGVLAAATPREIETALLDEQTDEMRFDGDVFGFTVTTHFASRVYGFADELRAAGKKVILGGIHVTVRPDEAMRHADAIVTGEAEEVWPTVCADLLAGRLRPRYDGHPTPPSRTKPLDYSFFGNRRYLQPACLFATRGCNFRCSFCVSSRFHGPFRLKPLDVLEREIDQLSELHPDSFLQFTDDNLLGNREYGTEVLALLRRKRRRFAAMVTLDQFCDRDLVREAGESGCIGVAVGVESIDDDNCASVSKYQNVGRSVADAARWAGECGMQVALLLILGLPHDTPSRTARTLSALREIPAAMFDLRILRLFPGSDMFDTMLARGDVTDCWWLRDDPLPTNHVLPNHLRVYFRHPHFSATELQRTALEMTRDLNRMDPESVARALEVGRRRGDAAFAMTALAVRARFGSDASDLLERMDATTSAAVGCDERDSLLRL
ncbi:MAG: B12-binding domain-containing radical SAM protein [Planctomycetes bacterium]|nr:B12-binding domain-containing radical SAM protein [Planctomycetota bacterium]